MPLSIVLTFGADFRDIFDVRVDGKPVAYTGRHYKWAKPQAESSTTFALASAFNSSLSFSGSDASTGPSGSLGRGDDDGGQDEALCYVKETKPPKPLSKENRRSILSVLFAQRFTTGRKAMGRLGLG